MVILFEVFARDGNFTTHIKIHQIVTPLVTQLQNINNQLVDR